MKSRHPITSQLTFDDARRPQGWGGWRPNAGRPQGRSRVPHVAREEFSSRYPLHVTLNVLPSIPGLRDARFIKAFRGQIALAQHPTFRIAHFNLEDNHIHTVVECANKCALGRRVGSMKTRLARRINRFFGRGRGRVFEDRYHARVLRSPREVRNALRYVLNNYRHHAADRGEYLDVDWFDPFSSAAWFDGWAAPLVVDCEWKREVVSLPAPTMPATTWLLTTGWRRWGLIGVDEVPGVPTPKQRRTPKA